MCWCSFEKIKFSSTKAAGAGLCFTLCKSLKSRAAPGEWAQQLLLPPPQTPAQPGGRQGFIWDFWDGLMQFLFISLLEMAGPCPCACACPLVLCPVPVPCPHALCLCPVPMLVTVPILCLCSLCLSPGPVPFPMACALSSYPVPCPCALCPVPVPCPCPHALSC